MGRPTGNVSCVKWSEPSDRQRTADCSAAQESKVRALLSDGPNQWGWVTHRLGVLMGVWRERVGGVLLFSGSGKLCFFLCLFCFLSAQICSMQLLYFLCFAQLLNFQTFFYFTPFDPRACKETNGKITSKSLAFEASDSWFFEFKKCRQTLLLLLPGQRKHSCRSEETCR